MKKEKVRVTAMLTPTEKRIIEESYYKPADLLRQGIIGIVMDDPCKYQKMEDMEDYIRMLNPIINILSDKKKESQEFIDKIQNKIESYHVKDTHEFKERTKAFEKLLRENHEKRLEDYSWGLPKIKLDVAINYAKGCNADLKLFLGVIDEELLSMELEGYDGLYR